MKLPEITPLQMDKLCDASYSLLQVMSNIYGSDPAYEMFQKFEEVLGPELKGNLFLKMLSSNYNNRDQLVVNFTFKGGCKDMILSIKKIREFTYLGLKEANNIYYTALNGIGTITFSNTLSRDECMASLIHLGAKII